MGDERRVRVFRNGRNQAIRIPPEFELPGKEAVLRKEGARLITEPMKKKSLLEVISRFKPIKEKLPKIENLPPESVDL